MRGTEKVTDNRDFNPRESVAIKGCNAETRNGAKRSERRAKMLESVSKRLRKVRLSGSSCHDEE